MLCIMCPSVASLMENRRQADDPPTEREPRTIIHLSFVSLRGVKYSDVHVALADVALHPRGSSKRSSRRKWVLLPRGSKRSCQPPSTFTTSDGDRRPATSDESGFCVHCSPHTITITYRHNHDEVPHLLLPGGSDPIILKCIRASIR